MDRYGRFNAWGPQPAQRMQPGSAPMFFVPLPAQVGGYPWINTVPAPMPARKIVMSPLRACCSHATLTEPAPPGVVYPFIAANTQTTAVPFDMRKDPSRSAPTEYARHNRYSLFSQPVRHLRLVSREFPWVIEIADEWVTCGTVWMRVYTALQEYLTEIEWALASEERRRKIEKAVKHREAESGNRDLRPRRIDWLGEKTMFAGLEKDEQFVKQMKMPGQKQDVDTWIIRLDRRRG